MSDLNELYQQVILDHYKRPRNFQKLPNANCKAEGHNPLCGDQLTVYLHLDGDVITDISFDGAGCAISKASASMMTAALKHNGVIEIFAKSILELSHNNLAVPAGHYEQIKRMMAEKDPQAAAAADKSLPDAGQRGDGVEPAKSEKALMQRYRALLIKLRDNELRDTRAFCEILARLDIVPTLRI